MKSKVILIILVLSVLFIFGCTQESAPVTNEPSQLELRVNDACGLEEEGISKNTCIKSLAYDEVNLKICEYIPDSDPRRDWCFARVVEKTRESNDCEKINDANINSYCLALALGDVNYCVPAYSYYAESINWCYFDVAIIEVKPSICEKISGNAWKREKEWCIALTTRDYSICSEMEDRVDRFDCYLSYSIITGDKSVCDFVDNSFWPYKDECMAGKLS